MKTYIKDHYRYYLVYLVMIFLFDLILLLCDVSISLLYYPTCLCLFFVIVYFGYDYYKYNKKLKALHYALHLDHIYLENIPAPENDLEESYYSLIEKIIQANSVLNNQKDTSYHELSDYMTLWVHQIKTPIAALRLLLAEEEDERSQEMWEELFSIEQYVEMALQFTRLSAKSTDFIIGEVSLDKVVREAIHKYARLFVRKKIRLELSSIDTQVLTDEKWLEFVIEQILSNAIKYTAGGTISIYLKEEPEQETKELIIEDTGIGIAPEDLPRIFEKGYTGYNGHADKRSTGIGLYLCRKIMRKLSHEITIESESGVGTKVHLEIR